MSQTRQRTDAALPDICVVGGAGHVGLPLALVLCSKGYSVLCYDQNERALAIIEEGTMPFVEENGEELLSDALARRRLHLSSDPASIQGIPNVILTIGTPVDKFLNPSLKEIRSCIDDLLPYLSECQLLVLRSTVYPGTTEQVANLLKQSMPSIMIAYCPERIVQGRAVVELKTLPQIVGAHSEDEKEAATRLFAQVAPSIVRMSPKEAEFVKLLSNAWRYIQFAAANQFYMLTQEAGVDYYRVLEGMRRDYPRMAALPSAGFTAGPCLLKDTMQLMAFADNQFSLGNSAMLINEGLPMFLVQNLKMAYKLSELTVGLLGMAFKADIDDTRSSLSYKLKKVLAFQAHRVLTTDPYVKSDPNLSPVDEVIEESDVLILCVPHTVYRDLDLHGRPVVDVWNFWGQSGGL